ncbi:MAG: DUF6152 family protein [Bryobacteraceae bacterium]
MKKIAKTILALALGAFTLTLPAAAHHGNAAYDEGTKVTVKGVATEWIFENPHTILKFDVKDASGKVTHWVAETGNATGLARQGFTKDTVKPGDAVTVTMIPAKNGQQVARIHQLILPSGESLGSDRP